MISSRAGQVWELTDLAVDLDAKIVLLTQVVVPGWGQGYEGGVHEGVYLASGKPAYLTEEFLLTSAERLL